MMKIKTIILDFDGTVVESVGIKDSAFQSLFSDFSDKLDEIMEYHLTNNTTIRYEKFKYIYEKILGLPYSQGVEQVLKEQFSRLVVKKIIECPYVPGALEFLEHHQGKFSFYLVSMSPEEELQEILTKRDLKKYFKKIYAYPWRKVEAIADIIVNEQAPLDEVMFIGDAYEDYQAAKSAGIFFVGRNSGKPFYEASSSCPIVKSLTELFGMFPL